MMFKKLKKWSKSKNKEGVPTPLWRALLLEHRLPWRYKIFPWLVYYDLRFFIKHMINRKTILFYPDSPGIKRPYYWGYIVPKLCYLSGCKITNNTKEKFDSVFCWKDTTYRKNDKVLSSLSKKYEIINFGCKDISKKRVEKIFKSVFGYGSFIDPLIYNGMCIKKANLNAKDEEKIIRCPIKQKEEGFIYQKLVKNKVGKLRSEIRVPIFKGEIPLVYLKYKKRLDPCIHLKKIKMFDVYDLFSKEEVDKIHLFCKRIGLDCGELDIVRDNKDKKMYIIDVNNTPGGPPNFRNKKLMRIGLEKQVKIFEKVFIKNKNK